MVSEPDFPKEGPLRTMAEISLEKSLGVLDKFEVGGVGLLEEGVGVGHSEMHALFLFFNL